MTAAADGNGDQAALRKASVDAIVASKAPKRIIVAGAGTGKSFTFTQVLKQHAGNCLALTFINNLAGSLKKDLEGLADANTFHGFAKQQLHISPGDGLDAKFTYYPALNEVVEEDATYCGTELTAISQGFRTLAADGRIPFHLKMGRYYNAVGHDDAVFRVLQQFQNGSHHPPKFDQVVVDEYQDFNPLEVRFLQEMAKVSPVLLVGDDDQAIYAFKDASPTHLREAANHKDFTRFELPFCSRCTQVVVDAVHDIVAVAQKQKLMAGRVNKQYACYLPDKEADSKLYPKITRAECSIQGKDAKNYLGRYLASEIRRIPPQEWDAAKKGGYPAVLIIGPKHYLAMAKDHLDQLYDNVEMIPQPRAKRPPLLEGHLLLAKDGKSNLGWRLVIGATMPDVLTQKLSGAVDSGTPLVSLLDAKSVADAAAVTKLIGNAWHGVTLGASEVAILEGVFGMPWPQLEELIHQGQAKDDEEATEMPAIALTTTYGSKGLSAGWVFVVGLHRGDLPRGSTLVDHDVCQFIVALTRARKRAFMVYTKNFAGKWLTPSPFLFWIKPERIAHLKVDAAYLKAVEKDS